MFSSLSTSGAERVRFTLDGETHRAPAGISVAAALLSVGRSNCRTSLSGQPRGPYCMMGVCFDCLVCIDGEPNRQACMVSLEEGMRIETLRGTASVFDTARDC